MVFVIIMGAHYWRSNYIICWDFKCSFSDICNISKYIKNFSVCICPLSCKSVLMKRVITLEVGNTSWWKNRKYRREAASEIRSLREKNQKLKLIKKYRLESANSIVYADYEIT